MNLMQIDRLLSAFTTSPAETRSNNSGRYYITIDISINGLSTENRHRSQRTPTPTKMKVENCKLNRVNSSNYNATVFKFSKKFDHPFSHVFIFGNMFPESHGFVAMQVTKLNQ